MRPTLSMELPEGFLRWTLARADAFYFVNYDALRFYAVGSLEISVAQHSHRICDDSEGSFVSD
jgi:hypothetical protein